MEKSNQIKTITIFIMFPINIYLRVFSALNFQTIKIKNVNQNLSITMDYLKKKRGKSEDF